ncbi:MAG: acetyl-CoA carboxylase biotin carboxyl carrier protein subunit [Candidatus Calescibacterium sp.]|nr:acetyl-CoA carboxylase biotin carboxyl carrier protein subunit [Candidatus Calescibacterium sp.]MDW8132273.1 acetyl-CoA carboxylase biotin carboxyl carrier protein subunit [Candidatus Calescibacterium sp.]
MYIKNFYSNTVSNFEIDKLEEFEILKIEKKPYYLKLWLKIENAIYKLIIIKEKDKYKFFVFDGFNEMNIYEIFSGLHSSIDKSGDYKNTNIIYQGDFYFVVSPLSGKVEKINEKNRYDKDDVIAVISAMKMEYLIVADKEYEFVERLVDVGQFVDMNQKIVKLK